MACDKVKKCLDRDVDMIFGMIAFVKVCDCQFYVLLKPVCGEFDVAEPVGSYACGGRGYQFVVDLGGWPRNEFDAPPEAAAGLFLPNRLM